MKLLKQVIQVNKFTQIGEVLNVLIREKESNGVFSKEAPAKILIISDDLEKNTHITEIIANRMMNPDKIEFKTNRDREQHIQLNILAGLPCEVYTRSSCNVSTIGLQHCDYIIYVESGPKTYGVNTVECNAVILESVFKHDAYSGEIIKYLSDTSHNHPMVYNLLTVGCNLKESWSMFYYICDGLEFPKLKLNTPYDESDVHKNEIGYIMSTTRAVPGIPITFSWCDNEYFGAKFVLGPQYIILTDEIM